MRTVAVTGARGYVGRAVVRALRARGDRVRGLVRSPSGPDEAAFRLGDDVDPAALRGVDALIHAAHDFSVLGEAEMRRVNVAGSLRLLDAAAAAGVRRVVFVSSVSAYEGCASLYGRAKLEIERAARARGGVCARPGLVYGERGRGMFGALGALSRLPVLPVFDGGRQPLVLAHCDDVAAALAAAVDWAPSAAGEPPLLAHPERVPFVEILRALARGRGRTLIAVPVPSAPALAALRLLEAAGLPLRFRSDSLVSLLNPNPAPDFSGAERLGLRFRRFLDQDPASLV